MKNVKIAYLILAHTDPTHIKRLSSVLSNTGDVYIHVDLKSNIQDFKELLETMKKVYLIDNRIEVFWGGYSLVQATINLMEYAYDRKDYDRYVLLQGLEYPIKSDEFILDFFNKNRDVEFIRACDITNSKNKYFYSKCKYYWSFDNINFVKRLWHKISNIFDLKLRKGYVYIDQKKYNLFWGSGLWALTSECIKYILDFNKKQVEFNKYMKHVLAPDEIYFHSIVFNSDFLKKTRNGIEEEKEGLVNWRNLHYFEYDKNIKVFSRADFEKIIELDEIFIRKTNTELSSQLLDMLDNNRNNN